MGNRVLKYKGAEPIKPTSEAMAELTAWTRELFNDRPRRVFPYTYERFLQSYPGNRRKRYEDAVRELQRRALKPSDARVETFIKNEKFDWLLKRENADPRAIQPRKPIYLAEVGRWFKPLEHILYADLPKRLYGTDLPCIGKGLNAVKTAEVLRMKWERFNSPVCVSLDASRFDLHVSQPMLKLCHEVYGYYCQSPTLQRYLSWTLVNRGTASCPESAYNYEVDGRRMSGDMDTALGNCLIMTLLTKFILDKLGIQHEMLDNGDDCLFICERAQVPSEAELERQYKKFGFVVRLEAVVDVFERIEFCQTQPIWAGDRWQMCRQLSSIAKDLTDVNYCGEGYQAWLRAVGVCGGILNDGVPVFSAFHDLCFRLGTRSRVDRSVFWQCGLTHIVRGMKRTGRAITPETRTSFYTAFGITPDQQVALEQFYNSFKGPMGNIELHKWPRELKEVYDYGSEWFCRDGGGQPAPHCGPTLDWSSLQSRIEQLAQ